MHFLNLRIKEITEYILLPNMAFVKMHLLKIFVINRGGVFVKFDSKSVSACCRGVSIKEKICRTAGKAYPAEYTGTKCLQASLLIGKEGR